MIQSVRNWREQHTTWRWKRGVLLLVIRRATTREGGVIMGEKLTTKQYRGHYTKIPGGNVQAPLIAAFIIYLVLPIAVANHAWAEVLFYEDFESGPGQWPTPGSMVITSATAFAGACSQTFAEVAGGGDAHTSIFSVTPGESYYLHVAYMTMGGGGYIGINLFDASMAYLDEQWMIGDGAWEPNLGNFDYNVDNANPADVHSWKLYTQSYAMPDLVEFIRIKTEDYDGGLPNDPVNHGVYFDCIEWSTTPYPSFLVIPAENGGTFNDSDVRVCLSRGWSGAFEAPRSFALGRSYPDPLRTRTTITFRLPVDSYVEILVHDSRGQQVGNLMSADLQAGDHSLEWNASGLSSGVYLCSIKAGTLRATKRLVVLR